MLVEFETIASGGVKDIEDIEVLMDCGMDGVIIGKAFYEGTIDLREAFRLANGER